MTEFREAIRECEEGLEEYLFIARTPLKEMENKKVAIHISDSLVNNEVAFTGVISAYHKTLGIDRRKYYIANNEVSLEQYAGFRNRFLREC